MFFVIIGAIIVACNIVGLGPFANWNWNITGDLWKFCLPFVLGALWWMWTDWSGLDKRRAAQKMEDRKTERRRQNMEALGLDPRSRRKGGRK